MPISAIFINHNFVIRYSPFPSFLFFALYIERFDFILNPKKIIYAAMRRFYSVPARVSKHIMSAWHKIIVYAGREWCGDQY